MFSGKRAAVYIHGEFPPPTCQPWLKYWLRSIAVEMSREESKSIISKREGMISHRELEKEAYNAIGDNLEREWKRAQGL
jgi:hypothetical protein